MSKALTVVDQVKKTLASEGMKNQFNMALPDHISVKKFVRVAQTAIANNPNLASSNKEALYGACMKAAQDGLLPDGKEAALVGFGKSVQYMPMVAGILKKVRNSGELSSITSQIVYENDSFDFWIDSEGEHLEHRPLLFKERGNAIGVYAQAKTKDGSVHVEILTMDDLEAIRNVSRSKGGPWSGAFKFEMWKKSAIRRLSKRLPMSTDLEGTLTADDEFYDLNKGEAKEVKETSAKPTRLGKLMAEKEVEVEVDEEFAPDLEIEVEDVVPVKEVKKKAKGIKNFAPGNEEVL